jgi:hypothetical protein
VRRRGSPGRRILQGPREAEHLVGGHIRSWDISANLQGSRGGDGHRADEHGGADDSGSARGSSSREQDHCPEHPSREGPTADERPPQQAEGPAVLCRSGASVRTPRPPCSAGGFLLSRHPDGCPRGLSDAGMGYAFGALAAHHPSRRDEAPGPQPPGRAPHCVQVPSSDRKAAPAHESGARGPLLSTLSTVMDSRPARGAQRRDDPQGRQL